MPRLLNFLFAFLFGLVCMAFYKLLLSSTEPFLIILSHVLSSLSVFLWWIHRQSFTLLKMNTIANHFGIERTFQIKSSSSDTPLVVGTLTKHNVGLSLHLMKKSDRKGYFFQFTCTKGTHSKEILIPYADLMVSTHRICHELEENISNWSESIVVQNTLPAHS